MLPYEYICASQNRFRVIRNPSPWIRTILWSKRILLLERKIQYSLYPHNCKASHLLNEALAKQVLRYLLGRQQVGTWTNHSGQTNYPQAPDKRDGSIIDGQQQLGRQFFQTNQTKPFEQRPNKPFKQRPDQTKPSEKLPFSYSSLRHC